MAHVSDLSHALHNTPSYGRLYHLPKGEELLHARPHQSRCLEFIQLSKLVSIFFYEGTSIVNCLHLKTKPALCPDKTSGISFPRSRRIAKLVFAMAKLSLVAQILAECCHKSFAVSPALSLPSTCFPSALIILYK